VTSGTDDQIRLTDGSTPQTITLAASTELWASDDNTITDFFKDLKTKIDAAYSGAFSVDINGVSVTDTAKAEGRIKFSHSTRNLTFLFSHGDSTIDPRILGWDTSYTGATDSDAMSGGVLWAPYVHRFGWYPGDSADLVRPVMVIDGTRQETSLGHIQGQLWRKAQDTQLTFGLVHAALAREEAALEDAAKAALALLTTGDQNAPFEVFVYDCIATERKIRVFKDATALTTYVGKTGHGGDFRFPGAWIGAKQPLSPPCRETMAGPEKWAIVFPLRNAIG
jgi:hypothetical protein